VNTTRDIAKHWPLILSAVILLVFLSLLCSLLFGASDIKVSQLFSWILGQGDPQSNLIIGQLRLPRALLAAFVGAILACCGAVTQGLFRNPLADPSLIGVTAGATAGASLVIVLLAQIQHLEILGLSLVSFGAFIGGLLAVLFVYRVATGSSGTSVATMLLAGIGVSFLAGSLSSVFELIGDNHMLRQISLWRMGGLEAADYSHIAIIACVALPILWILPRHHAALNALLLGESEARHLGIDVHRLKTTIVLCVAAGIGVSVALAGSIAFIGLVVPHIVRMLVGPNHRYLIPLSAGLGAAMLIIADAFARTILAPAELPVGLVTSFIGAPVFISLLRSRHRYGMQN